ncbi:MAG: DEAD/DEAH box helicase [Polyangiaceae bacterium]
MTSDQSDTTQALPTFDVLPLSKELRRAIDELGYTHPTPVQREVFEPASRGRDLVVQARTGTGKTASFGLPVVDALVQRSLAAVQVVILCPTRELALQVHREIDTLGKYRGIRSVAVYGGAPMGRQIEELAAGAQVLVGTPGRVLDHLSRGSLDPKSVRTFILDESDEMLSMGFLPQINEIHGYLPPVHQTLLFSATLPPDIQRHAETRLKDPLFLTLSGDQIGALDIQHLVYLTQGDKLKDFLRVLEVENPESAIVFCNTRDETKRVAAALDKLGYQADWLNADLAQNEREKVMAATREGRLRFLVCTDVAARGIDISHLTHVINYDLPESAESYVHRTGRTGRAGRTGTAISLIEPSDVGNLYLLRLTYKIFPIERQLPSAGEVKTRAELDLVELFDDAFAKRTIHPDDLSLARRLLTHDNAARIVAALLRDHLGARPDAPAEATDARRAKNPPPQHKARERDHSTKHRAAAQDVPTTGRPSSISRGERLQEHSTEVKSSSGGGVSFASDGNPSSALSSGNEGGQSGVASLQVETSSVTVPSQPVREDSRREDSRQEDSRREDSRREDSRREDSRREDSRREDSRREHRRGSSSDSCLVDGSGLSRRGESGRGESGRGESGRGESARHGRRDSWGTRERSERPAVSPERSGDFRGRGPTGPTPGDASRGSSRERRTYRDEDFEFGYSVSEPPSDAAVLPVDLVEALGQIPKAHNEVEELSVVSELFVNVGRRDGARPGDFEELLKAAGVSPDALVAVNVRANHSFVRVTPDAFDRASAALNGAVIAGKTAQAEASRNSRL